jgi:hypothetical protein
VDYCSVIAQFVGLSSGQMLFGALLFLLKNSSNLHLENIVLAVASRWPNIEHIATQIEFMFTNDLINSSSMGTI